MTKHASIGGSNIDRAMLCPGSVKLSAGAPNRSSAAAARGTMLHDVMVQVLERRKTIEHLILKNHTVDGVLLTHADVPAVLKARAAFKRFTKDAARIELEKQVKYMKDVWGTADILGETRTHNLVGDFKFGAHEVTAEDNPQMLFYVGAAVTDGLLRMQKTKMAIIQPGKHTLSTANASVKAIKAFIADVRHTAALAFGDKPPINPGETQCQWCPAKNKCPARGVGRLGAALKQRIDNAKL